MYTSENAIMVEAYISLVLHTYTFVVYSVGSASINVCRLSIWQSVVCYTH